MDNIDSKELFLVSLIVFTVIVLWVIYDLYSSRKSEDILKDVVLPQLKVVKINEKIFDELRSRQGKSYEED